MLAGLKQHQQPIGEQLEQQGADEHDPGRKPEREADGLCDSFLVSRAEIIRDDRHEGIGHAQHGHEDELLKLIVDAEDRDGQRGKRDQDHIHHDRHEAHDRLHQNGWHRDPVHPCDQPGIDAEFPQADVQKLLENRLTGPHTFTSL